MKSCFMEKNMSEKNEEKKKIDNDPVLVFIISLPRNKDWTVIQGLYNWHGILFRLFVLWHFYFWDANSGLQARYETMFLRHILWIT